MERINVKYLSKMCLLTIITIIIVIILRTFLFASFRIPTSSMNPYLLPGDYVIVNKLVPGPRIDWWNGADGTPLRLKGLRIIQRNDILVFNAPYHQSKKIENNLNIFSVKRCIAIPGDTFYIKDGIYKVKNCPDTLGYYKYQKEGFTHQPLKRFSPKRFRELNWTIVSFGPIYIPGKGSVITLDSVNFILYKNLIEYETKEIVEKKNRRFFIGGKMQEHYRFKQNYYFVAGDYIFDSDDSRYWGLLPEDHIVGKVTYIWKSRDLETGEYRLDRFFKSVD